ncbi:MAG: helix-turn-helix transcriptional regulator [Planctomycetota bacterium]|jgi:putative transcriptional regulator
MKENVFTLGNKIKECRQEHNRLSQKMLAEDLGVSKLTIHLIENRRVVPSALLAFKIAQYFKKDVQEVFYLIDNQLLLDGKKIRTKKKKAKRKRP